MKLGEYRPGSLKIFNVRLGEGCSENCAQCAAYPQDKTKDPGDFIPREVTRDRIKLCLEREFDLERYTSVRRQQNGPESVSVGHETAEVESATRLRLIDLFANYVTTDINQEPLNGDAFLHFAQLVKELSKGKSRAVCISHGLRAKKVIDDVASFDTKNVERLRGIVDFMEEGDVFVLSLDMSRSSAKIDSDLNFHSYLETLKMLKPALDKGVRITVSVQGDSDKSGPLYRGKAGNMYDEICEELVGSCGWTPSEVAALFIDVGRTWISAGRAQVLPGVDPNGECPVIPDNSFVSHTLTKSTNMGFLDTETGGVWVHPHNQHRTYNDVVRLSRHLSARGLVPYAKLGPWEEAYVNDDPLPDLRDQFSRQARVAWLKAVSAARSVQPLSIDVGTVTKRPVVTTGEEGAPVASGFQREAHVEARKRPIRKKVGKEGAS